MKLTTLLGKEGKDIIEERAKKTAIDDGDAHSLPCELGDENDPIDMKVRLRATKKANPELYQQIMNFD